jgi:hypothetical protein
MLPFALLLSNLFALGSQNSQPDFDREIAPILATYCLECHKDGNLKGKLNLTTKAGIEKGGKSGPAVVSGKIGKMGYWQRKLTATEIDTLYCSGTATGASAIWNMRGTTEAAILADSGTLGYQLWKQSTTGTVGLTFSESFEGMRLLYSNPNIKYSVVAPIDNRVKLTNLGITVTRVAYYLQYRRGGTLWCVYVSMPSFV